MKKNHYLFVCLRSFLTILLCSLLLLLNIRRLLVVRCGWIRIHISSSIPISSHCEGVCGCFLLFLLTFLLRTIYDYISSVESCCLFYFFWWNLLVIELLDLRQSFNNCKTVSRNLGYRVLTKPERSKIWQILQIPEFIKALYIVSSDIEFFQVVAALYILKSRYAIDWKRQDF